MVDEVETRLSRARVSSTQSDRYATRQILVTRLSHRMRSGRPVLEASSDGKKTSKESATRCTAIT